MDAVLNLLLSVVSKPFPLLLLKVSLKSVPDHSIQDCVITFIVNVCQATTQSTSYVYLRESLRGAAMAPRIKRERKAQNVMSDPIPAEPSALYEEGHPPSSSGTGDTEVYTNTHPSDNGNNTITSQCDVAGQGTENSSSGLNIFNDLQRTVITVIRTSLMQLQWLLVFRTIRPLTPPQVWKFLVAV